VAVTLLVGLRVKPSNVASAQVGEDPELGVA